jgi:hypothetical protein
MRNLRSPQTNLNLLLIYLLIMLTSFFVTILLLKQPQEKSPIYEYSVSKGTNNVVLHIIRTRPSYIGLKAIKANITDLNNNGINGGFFWQGYLLSIAVINDRPVKGNPGDYGSGWFNTDRKRGTLVWDEKAKAFSIQLVEEAKELKVSDRAHYWAQGGISMSLRNEAGWAQQAAFEEMPAINEKRMRSGIVYDTHNNVYLVVTPTPCTGEEFRSSVIEMLGGGQLMDGLFLDGDGSSQLKVAQATLPGDNREIFQMITLLN